MQNLINKNFFRKNEELNLI